MSLNIELIRASFDEVRPIAAEAAEYFYKTLFERYPILKPLFNQVDIELQKKSLIGSLVFIIDTIDKSDDLTNYLRKLGSRHVKYGVLENHYSMVGDNLLYTFRHFFGEYWTEELEQQWTLAIQTIAQQMIIGARSISTQGSLATRKVEASVVELKTETKDLASIARQLARNILMKAIEQESQGELIQTARKKAEQILSQALHEEANTTHKHFAKSKVS